MCVFLYFFFPMLHLLFFCLLYSWFLKPHSFFFFFSFLTKIGLSAIRNGTYVMYGTYIVPTLLHFCLVACYSVTLLKTNISSFLHDVFTRQVVVTLALSDTSVAICVSLPSFAFDSCDFFPFRINGKIICELVSWKSWYSRHWVKPLGLPSLIVLLFCSFRHLKFSWRDF